MSTPAVCDRMHLLTVGWEYAPELVSLEGGTREWLKLPLIAILAHSPAGWVLLETGIDDRPYRGVTEAPMYGTHLPEFDTDGDQLLEEMAKRGVAPEDLVGAAVSHLHVDHSGGLRHLAAAGVPVAIQRTELEFATERAGAAEFYRHEDYMLDGLEWRSSTATRRSRRGSRRSPRRGTRRGTCPTACGWPRAAPGSSPSTRSTCSADRHRHADRLVGRSRGRAEAARVPRPAGGAGGGGRRAARPRPLPGGLAAALHRRGLPLR